MFPDFAHWFSWFAAPGSSLDIFINFSVLIIWGGAEVHGFMNKHQYRDEFIEWTPNISNKLNIYKFLAMLIISNKSYKGKENPKQCNPPCYLPDWKKRVISTTTKPCPQWATPRLTMGHRKNIFASKNICNIIFKLQFLLLNGNTDPS